jgi:hypothetical protein
LMNYRISRLRLNGGIEVRFDLDNRIKLTINVIIIISILKWIKTFR